MIIAAVYIPKGPLKKDLEAVDILESMLKVDDIDKNMESTIKEAIDEIKKLESTKYNLPDDIKKIIEDIETKLDRSESLNEMIRLLQEMKQNQRYNKYPDINTGIDVAISILEDGLTSIYSPESPYTVLYSVKGTAKKDAKGAVVGGVVGGATGGVTGAVVGAVAGAIGASVKDVIKSAAKKIWDWLGGLF